MRINIRPHIWLTTFFIILFSFGGIEALNFPRANRFFPLLVSSIGVTLCIIQLYYEIRNSVKNIKENDEDIVDIASDFSLPASVVRSRALRISFWYLSLLLGIWIMGFKITLPIFFVCFLRIEGKVRWPVTIILTVVSIYAIFFHFENLLNVYWPDALIKDWINISWLF